MIKNPFQRLVGQKENIKTYELIRLQAKTYRSLKNYFNTKLEEEKLSALDWSILGLLFKAKEGLRFIEIAQKLGVEPPFITELVSNLEKKKLVVSKDSPEDKRAKMVHLTTFGENQVVSIEQKLEKRIMDIYIDISANEWQTYRNIMEKLAK